MNEAEKLFGTLTGCRVTKVERREFDWVFSFGADAALGVPCPWRILVNGRIALGDCDHGQRFGLPEPVDAAARGEHLLLGLAIESVTVREDTGDLTIALGSETVLEVLNPSSAYEGWQLGTSRGQSVIALGGGELAIFRQ